MCFVTYKNTFKAKVQNARTSKVYLLLFLLLLVLSFSNEKGIDWRNYVNEELNLRLLFINSNKIKLAMHECAIQEFNLKLFNIPFLMLFYRRFFTCNTWPKDLEWIICNHDTNLIMISYVILLIDIVRRSQSDIIILTCNQRCSCISSFLDYQVEIVDQHIDGLTRCGIDNILQ